MLLHVFFRQIQASSMLPFLFFLLLVVGSAAKRLSLLFYGRLLNLLLYWPNQKATNKKKKNEKTKSENIQTHQFITYTPG